MALGEVIGPSARREALVALGAAMGGAVRERSVQLFAPLFPDEPLHEVRRDLAYGPHERHRLDWHQPEGSLAGRATLCFVHGGGFAGGDKTSPGSPFYDNIATFATRNGFCCANLTYRLAPEVAFPAGAEDVALALSLVERLAAEAGADPARLVLMGHSAGAAHVATLVARRLAPASLRGAVLSSGIYEPAIAENCYPAYYGEDETGQRAASSVAGVAAADLPVLVSVAELDPPDIQRQCVALLQGFALARGRLPELVQAEAHNHFSVMFQLGADHGPYAERLAGFVRRVCGLT